MASQADQADRGVPEAGHDLRAAAGSELVSVLVEVDVADPMQLVLDEPVPSGDRVHVAAPGSPHIVAVLDELATLTAFAERAVTRRIDTALGLLLTQGRACGITVVAAVQDPGKDIVGWRDLFPTRVAMRLDNPIQVAMVLGDGAREMGATADQISELTPGVAYVRTEGTRAIRRVRAAYLTDEAITTLAYDHIPPDSRHTATVTALPAPTLTGGETT